MFLVNSYINSQVITFKKNFGYLCYNDFGRCIQQTPDNGYIIAGYINDNSADILPNIPSQCYIIKIDSLGNTDWTKTKSYTDNLIYITSVFQTNDSCYIVNGWIDNIYTPWNTYGLLIKLDKQGDTLWTKMYINIKNINKTCQTLDKGYFLPGITKSDHNIHLIRTDNKGDTLWTKIYNIKHPYSATQSADSGYVITGCDNTYASAFLFKTDKNGDSLWFKTYSNSFGYASGYDVYLTSDKGYIITGETLGPPPDYKTATYLVKTDENGDTLWTKTYIGSNNYGSAGGSVQQTNDNGFIITGWIYEDNINYNSCIYLMKTDANGDTLWTKTFNCVPGFSYLKDAGFCVRQTNDQGYILAGQRYMGAFGGYDMYVIKTDSLGNVYNTSEIENELLIPHIKLKIYPNPFSNKTTIMFQLSESDNVKLKVYNYTGEYVATLFNHSVNAGELYKITFNTKKLPAGVYYGVLQTDNRQITKKMVIIK